MNINQSLGYNYCSLPIPGWSNPFGSLCFISEDVVAYNWTVRKEMSCCYFLYDITKKEVISDVIKYNIKDGDQKNFPMKSFYDDIYDVVHIFFR